jgi:hypothetical protein
LIGATQTAIVRAAIAGIRDRFENLVIIFANLIPSCPVAGLGGLREPSLRRSRSGHARTGNAAHPLHEFVHFRQVLKIGFFFSLNVPYLSAPYRVSVSFTFQPDSRNKRIRVSMFGHLEYLIQIAAAKLTGVG